jgi:HPt (histidine-containing phosphotransfer) domain-containing protein
MVLGGRLPGIDLEDARQRLGLPQEALERLLLQFAKGQRRMVRDLRAALLDEDAEEARRHAHSLAGAAGNLSILELRRLAKTVELAIKFGQGNLEGMMDDLEREAARVFAGLDMLAEVRRSTAPVAATPTVASPGSAAAVGLVLAGLAAALESGDLDTIQRAEVALREITLPPQHDTDLTRLRDFVAAFDHVPAAELARDLARRLGG